MTMTLISIINILPIYNLNDWEASNNLGVSTTFYLLQMVNQDLFLNLVGAQFISVSLLPLFSKFYPSVESVVIYQGIIFIQFREMCNRFSSS